MRSKASIERDAAEAEQRELRRMLQAEKNDAQSRGRAKSVSSRERKELSSIPGSSESLQGKKLENRARPRSASPQISSSYSTIYASRLRGDNEVSASISNNISIPSGSEDDVSFTSTSALLKGLNRSDSVSQRLYEEAERRLKQQEWIEKRVRQVSNSHSIMINFNFK
jgi:hypothetical protein